jgi:hypothetical protein
MKSRIRIIAMNGPRTFTAELLSDDSVIIYRDGQYVDEGRFVDGELKLEDEFVPDRSRLELQRKLTRAVNDPGDGADG